MPNFQISDESSEAVFVSTPAGDVVLAAGSSVEVDEALAAELRLIPQVQETAEDAPVEAPAKKDDAPAKTSKESK
jgi:hypothetical protein